MASGPIETTEMAELFASSDAWPDQKRAELRNRLSQSRRAGQMKCWMATASLLAHTLAFLFTLSVAVVGGVKLIFPEADSWAGLRSVVVMVYMLGITLLFLLPPGPNDLFERLNARRRSRMQYLLDLANLRQRVDASGEDGSGSSR